jgi:cytoskeletal protein CcmA (bactofilin family)
MKRLIVGRGISVRGKISACDKLIIEGNLEAELENCGTVEVSESGTFKGDAEIAQAKISGQFEGSLTVRERLLVRTTGRVSGTVRYGRLHIEDGGEINGDVKSLGTVSPKYTAQAEQSPKADLAEVREARRFSLMITTAQRAQLKTRGYNDAAIDEMTPELAHRTLGLYS